MDENPDRRPDSSDKTTVNIRTADLINDIFISNIILKGDYSND